MKRRSSWGRTNTERHHSETTGETGEKRINHRPSRSETRLAHKNAPPALCPMSGPSTAGDTTTTTTTTISSMLTGHSLGRRQQTMFCAAFRWCSERGVRPKPFVRNLVHRATGTGGSGSPERWKLKSICPSKNNTSPCIELGGRTSRVTVGVVDDRVQGSRVVRTTHSKRSEKATKRRPRTGFLRGGGKRLTVSSRAD